MSRSRPEAAAPAQRARLPGRAEAMLHRLDWTVLRRLDGALQGDYRSLFRGTGLDLADLREYQHHDDPRHIDWNVTARLQVPHVRQYTEDRDVTAWFLVDLSPSVGFGSNRSKHDVAVEFTMLLARLLTRRGNRVGALLYGSEVDTLLPPRSQRLQVLKLLEHMRRPRPPKPGGAGTSLYDLLAAAEGVLKRRSIVFLLSDFISAPGWEAPLARLARRHDVVAVRLYDPLEMALPDVGLVTLEDAETGEQLLVDASDPAFRQRYADIAQDTEAKLQAALAQAGVDTLELATDDDLLDSLLRFAELRRARSRRKPLPAHLRPVEVS